MKSFKDHIRFFIIMSILIFLSITFEGCQSCSHSGRAKLAKERNENLLDKNNPTSETSKDKSNEHPTQTTTPKNKPTDENINKTDPNNKSTNKKNGSVAQMFKDLQSGVFMVFAYDDEDSGVQGSGFFINSSGIGITNYHVLQGFKKYSIRTSDGEIYHINDIIETSKPEDNDYVIFKVETRGSYFKSLPIAKNRSSIGDDVFAIGSPRGLENSLTRGSVSQYRANNRIQIDATIEQGSSGGPLFNMKGEVIGIISSKLRDTDAALNFAVDIQVIPYHLYVKKKVVTNISTSSLNPFLLPTSTTDQIIKHNYFTVSYSEKDEQAEWVAYKVTLNNFNSTIKRTNDYRSDPYVKTKSAETYDYQGSGYDMGHLAPARTMSHNYRSMSESFYLSNISPQVSAFNRGIWKKLEQKIRYWAAMNDSLFVVTGPILKVPIDIIGDNDVTVPRSFYKTLLSFKNGKIKGIAFVMPNQQSNQSIYTYATSIDEVEKITGIDFYHNLNTQIQNEVEANDDIKKWALNK